MAVQKQDDQHEHTFSNSEDTGCCPEDLPEAMNDREEWRVRVRDIRDTQRDMMMMMNKENELKKVSCLGFFLFFFNEECCHLQPYNFLKLS